MHIIYTLGVYLKSLKNRHQREGKGTQHVVTKSQRQRQRMFNVSWYMHACYQRKLFFIRRVTVDLRL